MQHPDCRAPLSAADFDAIPVDEECPIDGYYEALIDRNERVPDRFLQDVPLTDELTRGQQLLILLGAFDSQVSNGGITQFFWNCPRSLFAVRDALADLGSHDLLSNYERALEALVGKKDRWLELQAECSQAGDNPSWETFRQTYELLDLGWFDDAYFGKWGHNERGEFVQQRQGLQRPFLMRLADYVKSHRAEFIAE
jgi:hypothetical protein